MAYLGQDLEVEGAIRFTTPLKSSVLPRWQRKAMMEQQQQQIIQSGGDRFIPNRQCMDMDVSRFNLLNDSTSFPIASSSSSSSSLFDDGSSSMSVDSPAKQRYQQEITAHLFEGSESSKILAFKNKAPAPRDGYQNNLKVLYSQNKDGVKPNVGKVSRHIPQQPVKVLDAPDLLDDYYLNLLDWSDANILSVGLGQSVYLWNAETGDVSELMQVAEGDHVTSVSWIKEGGYLAVGTNNAEVQIWDAESSKKLRTLRSHETRVGSISWNEHLISSGCKDGAIHNSDVRVPQALVSVLRGHTHEVCGLKWSLDGSLLASGGNDNLLNIWDIRHSTTDPKFTMNQHLAAVKALAWCPWQSNLLASGAGTNDRHIRFWNTADGTCLNAIDTRSQVCSIVWSKEYRELVSSHGFAQNQLTVWKYPTMTKVTELNGHTSRVLHMAISPDGQQIASAAADETLRIWKCFESAAPVKKSLKPASSSSSRASHGMATGLYIR